MLLCQAIDTRLKAPWTSSRAVRFAGDSHLWWSFDSFRGFEPSLTELRCFLKIFERFGMIVTAKKTKAILMTTGHHKGKIQQHYVRSGSDGKRLLLQLNGGSSGVFGSCDCLRPLRGSFHATSNPEGQPKTLGPGLNPALPQAQH